jgi:hypothetical protein
VFARRLCAQAVTELPGISVSKSSGATSPTHAALRAVMASSTTAARTQTVQYAMKKFVNLFQSRSVTNEQEY